MNDVKDSMNESIKSMSDVSSKLVEMLNRIAKSDGVLTRLMKAI